MDKCFNIYHNDSIFRCSHCRHTFFLKDVNGKSNFLSPENRAVSPKYCPNCKHEITSKITYSSTDKAYEYSMNFQKVEDIPEKVQDSWHLIFQEVAGFLGFDGTAIDILWNTLVIGNWEHLHATDEEKALSEADALKAFKSDVFYCSDRWSLDRLTRCHWLYRQYMRKAKGFGYDI